MNDQLTIHNKALRQKSPKKAAGASNADSRGLFHQHPAGSPKINSQKIQGRKSLLRWEPQAEIPCAWPKHAFGHTHKVPAWNPHTKYDLRTTQTSRGHYEAIVKHPLISRGCSVLTVTTPARWVLPGGMQQHQASLSQRAWQPWMQQSVPIR